MRATWPEFDLSEYDALSRLEQWAWRGFFRGGRSTVIQFDANPDMVFMGKAECEWVPFSEFWTGKVVDLGWVELGPKKRGKADVSSEFQLIVTKLGEDVYDACLDRSRKRSALQEIQEFAAWLFSESHNATPQQHQTATSAENHNETDS